MAGHGLGHLQEKGGFADAGIASQQHQGPRHQASPQHPIELLEPRGETGQGRSPLVVEGGGAQGSGDRGGSLPVFAEAIRATLPSRRRHALLHQGIPTTAGGAAPKKLPTLGTTGLTDEEGGGAGQRGL
jgi:hypothetical protein